jgi:hypothetical protein
MLTGPDLLTKVKELGDVSKSDLVRACGYVSGKHDGGDWLNFTAFYEALLEAKGISLGTGDGKGSGRGRPGRQLSYATKVQFNGNLMVGKAYTALLGLKPGDEFRSSWGAARLSSFPWRPRTIQMTTPARIPTISKSNSSRSNHHSKGTGQAIAMLE